MAENAVAIENVPNVAEILPLHQEENVTIKSEVRLGDLMHDIDTNPIIASAAALLASLIELKHNPICEDMHILQQNLIKEIVSFENRAKQRGIEEEVIDNARYILCASFDELILNYCSDKAGNNMMRSSLISVFYHETSGGENAFVLLEKLLHNPATNIDLLELISLCLSLGFEGKYRVMERGHEQLGILRDQLWRCIQQQRGDIEKPLFTKAAEAKVVPIKKSRISLGKIIIATVVSLVIVGFAFNFVLTQAVKPAVQMLQQV